MKMKRLLALLLALAMCFALLAGCGEDDEDIDDDEGEEEEREEKTDKAEETDDDNEIRNLIPPEDGKGVNILVFGLDNEMNAPDVVMLCRIDPDKNSVNIMSIPRDTKVSVNGQSMKLNAAYASGNREKQKTERLIDTIEYLTGAEIHHYFRINLAAFRDAVDALGGVHFDVKQNMNYEDPLQDLYIHLTKGYQLLDGDKAEQLVRYRQYQRGDLRRIEIQQDFLKAMAEEHLKMENVLNIPKIYEIIEDNLKTDLYTGDLLNLGRNMLKIGTDNFYFFTLPGYTKDGEAYYFCDVDETDKVVEDYFEGEDD